MRHQRLPGGYFINFAILLASWFCAAPLLAQDAGTGSDLPTEVLTASARKKVDQSVERALRWLASQQRPDGSFPTQKRGQPGVTGLCMLAFLSQGHLPGEGEYGNQLKRSMDYIISCQKRNGVLAAVAPNGEKLSRAVEHSTGYTLVYNHAIAGLVLSECYGMVGAERSKQIEPVIKKALSATCQMQDFHKDKKADEGGWRYLDDFDEVDSDLSITGWQLMFMRSAKNAGFDVDGRRITRAVEYVRRCFLKKRGTFTYKYGNKARASRAMAGAGILALAHSGLHETPEAHQAGDWMLKSGFDHYNGPGNVTDIVVDKDRYHYGLLTCSLAMYQLGGRHWREFFPPTARVLVANQNDDGSWQAEKRRNDAGFGNAYTTAIGVIALSASNDLLPIFQR